MLGPTPTASDSADMRRGPVSAFLMSSQVKLVLQVQDHFEKN